MIMKEYVKETRANLVAQQRVGLLLMSKVKLGAFSRRARPRDTKLEMRTQS